MTPGYIYFDLDNTLLDHTSAEEKAHKAIFSKFSEFEEISFSEWLGAYKQVNHELWNHYQNGDTDRESLQYERFYRPLENLKLTTDRSETIGASYMQEYRKYWTWVDGAKEAIDIVSERYPIGIVTNGFLETQQLKIESMELSKYTDNFIITEEIGVMKPHPRVFDVATEKAGSKREQILYVGDSYSSDIMGGRNAGWKTAWFTAFLNEIEQNQTADFMFDQFPMLIHYLNGE